MKKILRYVILLLHKKKLSYDLIINIINNYLEYLTLPIVKRTELELLVDQKIVLREFKNKKILFKLINDKYWKPLNFKILDNCLNYIQLDYNLNYLVKYNLEQDNILISNIKNIYNIIPSYFINYLIYRNTILKNINYKCYKFEKNSYNIDIYLIIIENIYDIIIHNKNSSFIKIYIADNSNNLNILFPNIKEDVYYHEYLENPYFLKDYLHCRYSIEKSL